MSRHFLSAFVAILLLDAAASAHDLFIMPDAFRVARGQQLKIGFHSADGFPESTTLAKRLTDAALLSSTGRQPISLSEDGKRMAAEVSIPGEGHVIVTVTNAANTETMRAASFLSYIQEEGLSHVIEARAKSGEAEKPARERYTMFAKSLLLAGRPDDGYKRIVGQTIEIVPEKDPYALKNGEALPVRVLLRGAPAANLEILAASTAQPKNSSIGRTDAGGRIMVPVHSGKWRLHGIHMERVPDASVADWESFWATLTFEVP